MNDKKKKILLISAGIFVIIVIIVNILLPKEEEVAPLPTSAGSSSGSYFSTENRGASDTPSEEVVRAGGSMVKNFYTEDAKVSPQGDVLLTETSTYSIFYFKVDDSFLISITSPSFEDTKEIAEEDFLRQLEIDEDRACRLNVSITTPYFVNPDQAGKNWPLSFCSE